MKLEQAPVIGRVGPQPDGLDAPFWDALARGRLVLPRCAGCRRWIWAPQWSCPSCHRVGPEWEEVEPRGTIFTWIRTWQEFTPELAGKVPFVTVVVELPDADGVRLIGILVGDDSVDPRIGEPVEGVIQPGCELTGGVAVLRWRRTEH